jgi:hypothetical protein
MEHDMSDLKSKLPDLNELGSMASKLYKGIKGSIDEIIVDYKKKHAEPPAETQSVRTPPPVVPSEKPPITPEPPPVVPKSSVDTEKKPFDTNIDPKE